MRRLALFLATLAILALPAGAAATVSGGCLLTGSSSSAGSVDLTTTAV